MILSCTPPSAPATDCGWLSSESAASGAGEQLEYQLTRRQAIVACLRGPASIHVKVIAVTRSRADQYTV